MFVLQELYCLLYNVYCNYFCVFIEMYVYTKFCFDCMVVVSVSAIPIYVPIVMFGLRLFIVVLQELHYLLVECSMKSLSFVLIECCVTELHSHLCPYCNV